jgi:hypothetical protein
MTTQSADPVLIVTMNDLQSLQDQSDRLFTSASTPEDLLRAQGYRRCVDLLRARWADQNQERITNVLVRKPAGTAGRPGSASSAARPGSP